MEEGKRRGESVTTSPHIRTEPIIASLRAIYKESRKKQLNVSGGVNEKSLDWSCALF
mgnify:CR=1 FL=1